MRKLAKNFCVGYSLLCFVLGGIDVGRFVGTQLRALLAPSSDTAFHVEGTNGCGVLTASSTDWCFHDAITMWRASERARYAVAEHQ